MKDIMPESEGVYTSTSTGLKPVDVDTRHQYKKPVDVDTRHQYKTAKEAIKLLSDRFSRTGKHIIYDTLLR
jgi:hypothetical protein